MKQSVFSLANNGDKVEILHSKRGSYDILYYYKGYDKPVIVNVVSLSLAMELVREFNEETALEV